MTDKSYTIENAPEESLNQLMDVLSEVVKTDTKFTPGPWRWAKRYSLVFGERTEDDEDLPALIGLDNTVVCSYGNGTCYYPTEGTPPNEANAYLIAAAPELYEALETLFNSYKDLADSGDAGFWKIEDQPEGKQALAALAKARGESL